METNCSIVPYSACTPFSVSIIKTKSLMNCMPINLIPSFEVQNEFVFMYNICIGMYIVYNIRRETKEEKCCYK